MSSHAITTRLYLLRSRLRQQQVSSVVKEVVVCSSAGAIAARLRQEIAANYDRRVCRIVCIGPPEADEVVLVPDAAGPLLDTVSREVVLVLAVRPRPLVFLETIPVALLLIPGLQDWREPQAHATLRYWTAERFNDGLRGVATTNGIWLLDCDRALARKGVQHDCVPVDPGFLECELQHVLDDACSPSSSLEIP